MAKKGPLLSSMWIFTRICLPFCFSLLQNVQTFFQILLHQPDEIPSMKDQGFSVAPGTHVSVGVKRTEARSSTLNVVPSKAQQNSKEAVDSLPNLIWHKGIVAKCHFSHSSSQAARKEQTFFEMERSTIPICTYYRSSPTSFIGR